MNKDDILRKALTTTSTIAVTTQQQQQQNIHSSSTIATTTITSVTASRPIVVLAGWMGCHEKSLQRYKNLYINELGFTDTLITIASPAMIVGALVKDKPTDSAIVQPQQQQHQQHLQPNSTLSLSEMYNGSLDAYAWDVIYDIHTMILNNDKCNSNSISFIIFHVFSNGGFLLWETIRRILFLSNVELQTNVNTRMTTKEYDRIVTNDMLHEVQSKIKGIVMDSCPAMDVHKLPHALAYVSWKEQLDVIKYCGFDYLLVHFWKNNIIHNATHYFHSVQNIIESNSNDSSNTSPIIPHLFLYSTNDPLSNSIAIDNVIKTRRDQYHQLITCSNRNKNINSNNDKRDVVTFAKRWETSQHCAHYIAYPVEYKNEIEKFLTAIGIIKANTIPPRAKL